MSNNIALAAPDPVPAKTISLRENARKSRLLFVQRLETACLGHPHCPPGRGQQKWLRESLLEKTGVDVSPEAVRKWFAGSSMPRTGLGQKLALVLDVDPAWLLHGIRPNEGMKERRQRNATVTGAVNIIAGIIQAAGGHIAFPNDSTTQIQIILGGILSTVEGALGEDLGHGKIRFTPSFSDESLRLIGVVLGETLGSFELIEIPHALLEEVGDLRGDFWDVIVSRTANGYSLGGQHLPIISDLDQMTAVLRSA